MPKENTIVKTLSNKYSRIKAKRQHDPGTTRNYQIKRKK